MVNVLIVEDSRVVSEYLHYILSRDSNIQVIGNVSNGREAVEFLKNRKPDVITMDIDMPLMNGLEATRIIMSTTPIPIIIVTASRNANEIQVSMEALAAGALSVIEKPVGIGHPKAEELGGKLVTMVKLMSEIKVITRKSNNQSVPDYIHESKTSRILLKDFSDKEIIAIGISSGGPMVLKKVFSKISDKFPYPILVVQHITDGFLEGLVDWLNNILDIPIQIATQNEAVKAGRIYFAPNNYHMRISNTRKIRLTECNNESICPSVSHLFSSVAKKYGRDAIGVILTGMGSDGANELKILRDTGAITIAQDKESSLVHGMPGVAIKLNAADYILNPDEIAGIFKKIELSSQNQSVINLSQRGNGHEK